MPKAPICIVTGCRIKAAAPDLTSIAVAGCIWRPYTQVTLTFACAAKVSPREGPFRSLSEGAPGLLTQQKH